jgi:hypothetical protein
MSLVFLGALQQLKIDQGVNQSPPTPQKAPARTVPHDDMIRVGVQDPKPFRG